MRRILLPLALSALLLAGCTASSGAGDEAMTAGGDAGDASEETASAPDAAADGSVTGGVVTADADRQVVVSGTVTMTVDDPVEAAGQVADLVARYDGFVAERVQQSARDEQRAFAYLTVRVPADRLTDAIAQLGELGTVEDTSLTSTEVSAQARDLDARIRALEISITRLEDLLGRSGSIEDIVAAEQVLTDRQERLEQLESERAALADQVAMSTVRIELWTDEAVPDEPPSGFLTGLQSGWDALIRFLENTLTVVGVLLPWLVLAGVVVAVVVPVVRWRRRRRPAAPLPAPTSALQTGADALAAGDEGAGPTTSLPPV